MYVDALCSWNQSEIKGCLFIHNSLPISFMKHQDVEQTSMPGPCYPAASAAFNENRSCSGP